MMRPIFVDLEDEYHVLAGDALRKGGDNFFGDVFGVDGYKRDTDMLSVDFRQLIVRDDVARGDDFLESLAGRFGLFFDICQLVGLHLLLAEQQSLEDIISKSHEITPEMFALQRATIVSRFPPILATLYHTEISTSCIDIKRSGLYCERMIVHSDQEMKKLGSRLGHLLRGGECIELLGDVGAGKTTLVKGVAEGLVIDEDVQSPSFTLSREYAARDGLTLAHYDFYRLHKAGVLSYELAESLADPYTITVVEWGETIGAVLPDDRVTITLAYRADDEGRDVSMTIPASHDYLEAAQ